MLKTGPSALLKQVSVYPMIPLALFRSPTNDGIIIAVVGVFAGLYVFYRGFRLLQRKRLILDTPASKIRSAAMGLVEINGLAVGPYTMLAPITGAPCYYFRTTAWQLQQQGKNKSWVKVAEESLHLPFFLDDNTGRVLVDPQGAEMDIHRDFHDEFSTSLFSTSLEMPPNIADFLVRHGVSTDKKIKIDEYCIKPKNALFILGTLAPNPGLSVSATPVLNLSAEQRALPFHMPNVSGLSANTDVATAGRVLLSAFKSEPMPLERIYLSDARPPTEVPDVAQREKITAALMKAGITNPAAWAVAGVNPSGATHSTSSSSGAGAAATEQFDLHPPTVLMKGTHDPAFLISWHSQRDVVRSLSWKCTLMIWGGPALTLLCAYIVAAHFAWL
jgi:E3 Ubiquitin ligase